MKIGFSFGRCVRDIVNNEVNLDDVLIIISRTLLENEDNVKDCIAAYCTRRGYLLGLDYESCLDIGLKIWQKGLLHQPRRFGRWLDQANSKYVWMDVVPTFTEEDSIVKEAWNNYRMLLKLSSDELPPDPGKTIS